jgi:RecA/RadA recombinase
MKFPTSILNDYFRRFPLFKGIISVWGDFGVGKTTFAMQTSMNSIKNENRIIYIYSKPAIPYEIINRLFQNSIEFLDKISFIFPNNFEDLHNIVFNLEYLILRNLNETNNQITLIVIDSLTDLYRLELNREKKDENYNLNYNLNQILANLSYINDTYDINILTVNEKVQTRDKNQPTEIQSGGKVMEYWIALDIKIERTEILKKRKFSLTKHPEEKLISFMAELSENGFL